MASPGESSQQDVSEEPVARKRKASPSLMENIKLAGRGIRRLVTLFTPLTRLVAEYDQRHQLMIQNLFSEDIDLEDPRAVAAKVERERDFRSVKELFKLIPDLIDVIESTVDTPKLQAIYRQLQEGANDARSSDVSRIKSAVADWLNERISGCKKFDRASRKGRGIQNDITGRLLCPISLDWDDPIVRGKVRNFEDEDHYFGKNFYPRCLYLGEDGDPEQVEEGYLKNALLVKTYKAVFTSPSSASDVPNDIPAQQKSTDKKTEGLSPRRANVATLLNMKQVVTPRSIAYAAVQLHFALQNASEWRRVYDDFNYEEFYNFIVDYFEADQSPNARKIAGELLDWWNHQVFPKAATWQANRPHSSATSASMRVLKQQRAVGAQE